jgi:2-iminobutanoate/2-iminopropanoate deaminase
MACTLTAQWCRTQPEPHKARHWTNWGLVSFVGVRHAGRDKELNMEKIPVTSAQGAPPGGPYTPALRWGELLFVSGQVGVDPATGEPVAGDFAAEVRQVLSNVQTLVEAGGSSLDKVLRATVYLTDMGLFAEMNAVYEQFFPEPRPTRSTVQVGLAKTFRVEIDVIAHT